MEIPIEKDLALIEGGLATDLLAEGANKGPASEAIALLKQTITPLNKVQKVHSLIMIRI